MVGKDWSQTVTNVSSLNVDFLARGCFMVRPLPLPRPGRFAPALPRGKHRFHTATDRFLRKIKPNDPDRGGGGGDEDREEVFEAPSLCWSTPGRLSPAFYV